MQSIHNCAAVAVLPRLLCIVLVVVLSPIGCLLGQNSTPEGVKVLLTPSVVEFGNIHSFAFDKAQSLSREMLIAMENGEDDLLTLSASCGCIELVCKRAHIAPGKPGLVEVRLDPMAVAGISKRTVELAFQTKKGLKLTSQVTFTNTADAVMLPRLRRIALGQSRNLTLEFILESKEVLPASRVGETVVVRYIREGKRAERVDQQNITVKQAGPNRLEIELNCRFLSSGTERELALAVDYANSRETAGSIIVVEVSN